MGQYAWNPDDDFRERELDSGPTEALPGTEAKIAVMRDRVERDKHPHHPADAKWDDATMARLLAAMADFLTKEKAKQWVKKKKADGLF